MRSSRTRSRRSPKLHTYDPQAIGLGEFGKPGNYFARQVDRWTKQYRASETQHIEEVEKLIEWLPRTVPQQERVSIVHGDYRLDNMIFHPTEPRVIAVLDWELSTLGDPMADFTYLLMQWTMPGLANADFRALNIPTLEEAAKIYCDVTGSAVPDLNWYFSYNLFRLACITQGIAGRIRDGTAASAKARSRRRAPCRCRRLPGATRRKRARCNTAPILINATSLVREFRPAPSARQ